VLRVVPVGPGTFMRAVGVVEMIVGVAILARWTRLGAYAAAAWLVGIAFKPDRDGCLLRRCGSRSPHRRGGVLPGSTHGGPGSVAR
jgi:hypothetical protein